MAWGRRRLLNFIAKLRSSGGLLGRALLCWILGSLLLLNDEGRSYDFRFSLRGEREAPQQLTVIHLNPAELPSRVRLGYPSLEPTEVLDLTDSYFWDEGLWAEVLRRLLAKGVTKIGVTFYFGPGLGPLNLPLRERTIFQDPRIVWATVANSVGRLTMPLFGLADRSNYGPLAFYRDDDGMIRRYNSNIFGATHFVHLLAGIDSDDTEKVIHFRGGADTFPQFTLGELLQDSIPDEHLKNKIVIIGPEISSLASYQTPFGQISRPTLTAHLLDNALANFWVHRGSYWFYVIALGFLQILVFAIILKYPQNVALVIVLWLATLLTALSLWSFDTFSFWIPIISPNLQLLISWILLTSWKTTEIELRNFTLKQKQEGMEQVEQLKNNFVSLISHDLKTPIAKIDGLVDRMVLNPKEYLNIESAQKIQTYSSELNRYIQSILKILRIESRDLRLNVEVGDFNATVTEVVEQLQPLANEKELNFDLHLEPLFSMEADFTLIREVILNLIENAIKYSRPKTKIKISTVEENDNIRFTVEDQGEGIAAEDLKLIWQKFVRGSGQDLKTKGTGLGLYLVKYFVELHGGRVGITSQIGRGTQVFFELPIDFQK